MPHIRVPPAHYLSPGIQRTMHNASVRIFSGCTPDCRLIYLLFTTTNVGKLLSAVPAWVPSSHTSHVNCCMLKLLHAKIAAYWIKSTYGYLSTSKPVIHFWNAVDMFVSVYANQSIVFSSSAQCCRHILQVLSRQGLLMDWRNYSRLWGVIWNTSQL